MRILDIKRQMQPDDISVVRDLLRDAERADGHRPLSDHLWLDLVDGGREGFARADVDRGRGHGQVARVDLGLAERHRAAAQEAHGAAGAQHRH